MSAASHTLEPTNAGALAPGVRREPREDTVRIIEYARYPRDGAEQRLRTGFTRDISRSGLCVGVDRDERIGALLKVGVRDVRGHSPASVVARVVWTQAERDGRYWLGLELLADALCWELAA